MIEGDRLPLRGEAAAPAINLVRPLYATVPLNRGKLAQLTSLEKVDRKSPLVADAGAPARPEQPFAPTHIGRYEAR